MRVPILLSVAAAAVLALPADAQDRRQSVDTTYAFDRGGAVRLSIVSGEIRVVGANTNTIRINATIERGWLETSFGRTRASIEARSDRGRMGSARYELTVPVGTRVTASAVSGDITVRATEAEATISTVSGDLTVHDASGRVEANTVSGDVDVARVSGRIILESVSGEFRADAITGELDVESVSGTIELRNSRLDGIRAETVSGDLAYDGPFARSGRYTFNSHSGSVRVALPADAGADVELETFSGRIASDFPITLQPGDLGGRRDRHMTFRIGAGGARIAVETFSGNITIRRLTARGNPE